MVEFKKYRYGTGVETVLETEDEILEVARRNDGGFDLIVHNRQPDTDRWDDLTVTLRPQHFIELGNLVDSWRLCLFHETAAENL